MIKNQKAFIKIPILISILTGLVLIIGGGYFGINQYQNYQTERTEKERMAQEIQRQKDLEVEKLRQEVEALKNKEPQIIQGTIIKEVPTQKSEDDLPYIIKQWTPQIAYIECDFYYTDTKVKYLTQSGSGILAAFGYGNNPEVYVITNKHVIVENDMYKPEICRIIFPDYKNIISVAIENITLSARGYDWAAIKINNPDTYLKNLPNYKVCDFQLSIGESIIILGYPAIGARGDITVTEGIVSGYDGDYYITSAKVEQGHSGGAAVFPKANCYIGIPTFAKVGLIESLARILRAQKVFSGLNQ